MVDDKTMDIFHKHKFIYEMIPIAYKNIIKTTFAASYIKKKDVPQVPSNLCLKQMLEKGN